MELCFSRSPVSRWTIGLALVVAISMAGLLATAVRAQDATAPPMHPPKGVTASPVAMPPGNDALTGFLALAPDIVASASPDDSLIVQYGDAKAQLDALGLAPPPTPDSKEFRNWMSAVQSIALPDLVLRNGLQPTFADAFGFNLLQIDSGMMVGAPPSTITFLRGRFDQETLRTAWQKSGYKEVDVDGQIVYSLAAEPTVNLDSPIGQMVLSSANNAAILADGVVVFTPSLDLMRQVVGVAQGSQPSLAANPQVAALVSSQAEPLVSAILLQGNALKLEALTSLGAKVPPEILAKIKSEVGATGKLSPMRLALFGITAGGPLKPTGGGTPIATGANATFVIQLLMADQQAAQAATEIIPKRLVTLSSIQTRQPYTDLVTLQNITVAPDAPVVAITLNFAHDRPPAIWTQMIYSNDLLFLAWEE